MKTAAHDDVTQDLPVDRLLAALDQTASVRVIADNVLPGIAPRHHATGGTLLPDPNSWRHVPSSVARQYDCPAENKNRARYREATLLGRPSRKITRRRDSRSYFPSSPS
jgi:hypothetical protein